LSSLQVNHTKQYKDIHQCMVPQQQQQHYVSAHETGLGSIVQHHVMMSHHTASSKLTSPSSVTRSFTPRPDHKTDITKGKQQQQQQQQQHLSHKAVLQ
jgi:hypothetical protein